MDLPQACVPPGYHFRDVQLEMSLKPFWDASPATRDAVCRELFAQWQPLCRFAESISIQLWTGDGSEILEYQGDLDATLEWARYVGSANAIWEKEGGAGEKLSVKKAVAKKGVTDHSAANIGGEADDLDPENRGVHKRRYLYRPEPPVFTLRWLKELVLTLKKIGQEVTGKKIYVGTTFDIGPEFAVSKFKYEWHREICGGGALFGAKFIRCDAKLKGDSRRYAGFPDGIPDDTTFGAFLGRQSKLFLVDFPFDFMWFSNGFGFALEPWALTGALFDGREFKAAAAKETAEGIMNFWRDFRAECPSLPIRTRGTNLTTGIDLGSDASPIEAIYRDAGPIDAPVNSPWAALDGDVGLELAGWMSHIARLPRAGYRFRYYIHDPWWLNSPWLDRYQRQPFDIFLPLSVSRLQGDGRVDPPSDLAFLTIDDSNGQIPVNVPIEVTSHILHAREFLPDEPGPLAWVYPFTEYNDLALGDAPNPSLPFFGDWFVRGLIAHGVPVNTVVNSEDVRTLIEKNATALAGSILVAPVLPEGRGFTELLSQYANAGGRVLFYGPLQEDAPLLRELLQVRLVQPLEGDFDYVSGSDRRTLRHLPFLSAGPWRESASGPGCINVAQKGEERTVAVSRKIGRGAITWVRGSLATAEFDPEQPAPIKGPRLTELNAAKFISTEEITRELLQQFGLTIDWAKGTPANASPMLTIHRHRNAFVLSGYQPRSTVPLRLGLPSGAPIFPGYELHVEGPTTVYSGAPSWHHECRVFVTEKDSSLVTARIIPPIQFGYTLRLLISGLRDATVRFFPVSGTEEKLEILRQPAFPYFIGDFVKPVFEATPEGTRVTITGVSGELLFSW
jgi:hypothetical protein